MERVIRKIFKKYAKLALVVPVAFIVAACSPT